MPKSFFRRFTKKFFIITNIIIAVLFLLGCYGYWFNPDIFWPIGFLTIASFYFFLVLFVYMIFWVFIKPRWALISFITFLLGYKTFKNVLPLRLSNTGFSKIRTKPTLRLMTWNVAQFDVLNVKKKPQVKNEMIDLINDYQPDIACFQEMVCEDSTPPVHGHVDEFRQRLGFSDYFYSYNVKEDFWGHAHFGIIIFSKYPIINKQTVMYYPYDYNSIFQYADIVKGADTFRLFDVHLQSLRFSRENLKYIDDPTVKENDALKEPKNIVSKFKKGFIKRKVQADRIREEMDKSPYPVILCGDFNDVPNSYAYNRIGHGMKNAFVEKGAGLDRTFSRYAPTLRIDNIFVDSRYSIDQYTRVKKVLSDHFPIIADIDLSQNR